MFILKQSLSSKMIANVYCQLDCVSMSYLMMSQKVIWRRPCWPMLDVSTMTRSTLAYVGWRRGVMNNTTWNCSMLERYYPTFVPWNGNLWWQYCTQRNKDVLISDISTHDNSWGADLQNLPHLVDYGQKTVDKKWNMGYRKGKEIMPSLENKIKINKMNKGVIIRKEKKH